MESRSRTLAQGDPRVLKLGLRAQVAQEGTNPGRTANKAREHLRAVVAWAWEQDVIDALPRFPKRSPQRDVAGRYYPTKAEINALYFATHKMERPRGWNDPTPRRDVTDAGQQGPFHRVGGGDQRATNGVSTTRMM